MKLIHDEEVKNWAVKTLKIKSEHIIGEMPREWHRQAQLESAEREAEAQLKAELNKQTRLVDSQWRKSRKEEIKAELRKVKEEIEKKLTLITPKIETPYCLPYYQLSKDKWQSYWKGKGIE